MTARLVFAGAALAACLGTAQARASGPLPAVPAPPAGHWHEASLDEYRKHLTALTTLVEACARGRDMKACDPALVGQDDRVPLNGVANAERRLIRFGWLRVLLSKAQDKDEPAHKPVPAAKGAPVVDDTLPPPPTTTQLLQDAETRLANEVAQTEAQPESPPTH